jgi:spore coat protein U-like protein
MNQLKHLVPGSVFVLVLWLGWALPARADSCSATMTDVVFANVSPISGSDYYATGTLTVNCTLVLGVPSLLLPNITYCLSLGAGSGGTSGAWRTMANGGARLPYNLYLDSSYGGTAVWGGAAMPANQTPIRETVLAGVLGLGVYSKSYTIYGKIPASALAGVSTAGNANTAYASSFGADATFTYALSTLLGPPSCTSGTTTTVPFQVRATVINNCVVSASHLAFGNSNLLSGAVSANGAVGVQCTANNAYRVALNGGMHGSVAERRMRNGVTGETVRYQISNTPGGAGWGDGSQGTVMVAGTGTGAVQSLPMAGRVPAQPTPSPGDYKDTVTATIYF